MIKLSIIVPVYNAEKYIEKCLTSICNQTYSNIEIIAVNDGSTDLSLDILNKYAAQDDRIKIISQVNQGVVMARKTGVINATGDYIGYVDADDWIESDYYENIMNLQSQSNADIVSVGHFHDIGQDCTIIKNGLSNGTYCTKDIIDKILHYKEFYQYGITPNLVTKIIRTDILRETQQAVDLNIYAGEDAAVTYPSIIKANSICVSDIAGYHYVQHPVSMTKIKNADEITKVDTLIEYLKCKFIEYGVFVQLEKQLKIYNNYLIALRDIEFFDKEENKILVPYGELEQSDKVIIYGAGVLGQKINNYIKEKLQVVAWLDKNYMHYQKLGYDVCTPDILKKNELVYDYIIIANISGKVAESIECFLVSIGVDKCKIRWFSKAFQDGE